MAFNSIGELEAFLKREVQAKPTEIAAFVEALDANTGSGKLMDPTGGEQNLALWGGVMGTLMEANLHTHAAKLGEAWYGTVCKLQAATRARYHKGSPTHNTGVCYFRIGELNLAFWYHALAFIEDIISGDGQNIPESPATKNLRLIFGWSKTELKALATTAWDAKKESNGLWHYPERVLVQHLIAGNRPPTTSRGSADVPVNHTFLQTLLDQLSGGNNQAKKDSLEFVACYLSATLPSVSIRRNAKVFGSGATYEYEMDVVVTQHSATATYLLDAFGRHFLIECKNWESPIGVKELNHFVAKMRFHRCRCGIIFSREGMSGDGDEFKFAKITQLRWYQQDDCVVVVLNRNDLTQFSSSSATFGMLLLQRYEAVRFNNTEG